LTFPLFDNIIARKAARNTEESDFVKIAHLTFRHGLSLCSSLFFLVMLLCFSSPLLAADAGASSDTTSGQKDPVDPFRVQGYLAGKYVSRTSRISDEKIRDEDLFGELRLDIARQSSSGPEFHFFGTVRDDLSNIGDRKYFSVYEDIGNTYNSRTRGYLYEAHLDLNQPFSQFSQVRIGRQDSIRDEPVFFDGIAADVNISQKVALSLYGGAAVHLYEIDTRWGVDRLGGLGLDYFPRKGTSLSMDYLYVDDTRNLYDTLNQHDNLVSFKLGQRFTPNLKATAKIRYLNSEQRDMKLRIVGSVPEADIEMQAAYFRQSRTQNELSNEFSPYYDVIGQSNPYHSYDIRVRKLFGIHYAIDIGYFQRRLLDTQQESAFNRAYRRSYAVLDMTGLALDGLSFSVTGEQWKSGSQSFNSAGFDAGYAFRKGRRSPKVNAGSYYSLYKYDYYSSLGERTKVRTDYVKFEYPFAQHYALNGGYEFEHGLEDYHTAKLGMRYEF
jgi:hypothetical protein